MQSREQRQVMRRQRWIDVWVCVMSFVMDLSGSAKWLDENAARRLVKLLESLALWMAFFLKLYDRDFEGSFECFFHVKMLLSTKRMIVFQ